MNAYDQCGTIEELHSCYDRFSCDNCCDITIDIATEDIANFERAQIWLDKVRAYIFELKEKSNESNSKD